MNPAHKQRLLRAALGCGLALGLPAASWSQQGPGLGSGSGAGTGTGSSAPGLGGTGTGTESGRLGSTGSGYESATRGGGGYRPGFGGPLPRADLPGTMEALRDPTLGLPQSGLMLDRREVERITDELYTQARTLTDPGQRSEALERAARTHIHVARDSHTRTEFQTLEEARGAIIESWNALRSVNERLAHDNRSMSLIDTVILLAETYQDLGLVSDVPSLIDPTPRGPSAVDRRRSLDRSRDSFNLAARIANEIDDPNYKSETVYEIVESQARAGSQVALARLGGGPESPGEAPEPPFPQEAMADRALEAAAGNAQSIRRPVWRDRALLIASNQAAAGNRFAKGLDIVRRIPQPVVRADGLVRLAETQARQRDGHGSATAIYQEAARTVAAIDRDDPRAILADVLISSLILSGRFEDARASIPLIRDAGRQFEARGMIAEMMGRRGLDREARTWIVREVPPAQQSQILRRMSDGMIASVEQYRTSALATTGTLDINDSVERQPDAKEGRDAIAPGSSPISPAPNNPPPAPTPAPDRRR